LKPPKAGRDVRANKPLTKGGPGRPRDPAADEAVLRGALELFIEHGIEGASFEQIAQRSGVARTTIYRRWSSREDLLAQAIAVAREAPEQRLAEIDHTQPAELTGWLVEALSETVTKPDYRKIVAKLIGSVPNSPKLMSVYWDTYLRPRRTMVTEVMERARINGWLPKGADSELLQDMIGGAIMYHLLIRPGHRSVKQMRAYIRAVLRQLGIAVMATAEAPRTRSRDAPMWENGIRAAAVLVNSGSD
jgi:AcrR family transcriptional regulator